MALLGAFQILLQRYTGHDDVAVGCPVANRARPELELLIGFFVNFLVMRTDLSGNPTFRELLGRVRETALSAYAHQDMPFEKLVEQLQPQRDPSRNPLFQVTFQIIVDSASGQSPATGLREIEIDLATSKFDLRCDLWPAGDGFTGHIEYSSDLFEPETVEAMARYFEAIVAATAATPDSRISEVSLADVSRAPNTGAAVTSRRAAISGVTVTRRFEAAAASDPALLAVRHGEQSLTYGSLNTRANRLARILMRRGVMPGSLVVLLLERSIDLVTSALAVLKTGAAYVPLDLSHPNERLALTMREALAPLVITTGNHQDRLPEFAPYILLDREAIDEGDDPGNLEIRDDQQNLAYVIFTSGSTGKPHGVEILHSGLCNLVDWHQREYGITARDRATLYASPAFDASVWEMWPYLTCGASLHIPDEETHASNKQLARWMAQNSITISFLPTPVAESFIAGSLPHDLSLRALLTGGDKLRGYPRRSLPFRFVNHYGPTENTVVATFCDVAKGAADAAPPIGKPITNVTAHVLDEHRRPVPKGVRGELYLGGESVARGYLNDAELTNQRFVPNPFDLSPGARLYKTGDLVRENSSGNLEFCGRIDGQIKLRGFRIEPGEIECALDQHPSVEKSIVVARVIRSGEKKIAAYVAKSNRKADESNGQGETQIDEWEQIYEQLYTGNGDQRDETFDLVGWNSSYTGAPLTREEMEEQIDATVSRIETLGARRILEIGCGTGLLLLRLAGNCTRYVGTDFSRAALAQVGRQAAARNWSHVELWPRRADDFTGVDPGAFDLVVLNSVVQYFPGMPYFLRVLEGAIRAVRPGGFVYIGDVRHRGLLRLLHAGIELARADSMTSAGELRVRVERRDRQERELVLDPEFFAALPGHFSGVTAAAVELRRGRHQNELTRFRYDALLEINGPPRPRAQAASRNWDGLGELAELEHQLQRSSALALHVSNVPNARLLLENQRLMWLDGARANELLCQCPSEAQVSGVDPEQVWALASQTGYRVQLTWPENGAADRFDIHCARDGDTAGPGWTAIAEPSPPRVRPWNEYANQPTLATAESRETQKLREFLRRRLPEYMVPATFVWMDALPLTPNGKLDRRALPDPEAPYVRDSGPCVLPRDDVEKKIAQVWREELGLDRIGIHHNFFDIGGHSLMLVKVHNRLARLLNTRLTIVDLFRLSTVDAIARAIHQERRSEARQAVDEPLTKISHGASVGTSADTAATSARATMSGSGEAQAGRS
jgi:amino acid adenylation domain-containing protein